ncbi:MAG: phosphatidylglycerophosphatase A [Desulfobacteraceae bacterium]|jgi:phosphatidylglycerophosphatase A|nr:phosphatidylglycerophosphatase A [Desulfobacteraceae bacterium]
MNFANKTAVFLATGFYIGKIPVAPGTFGSLIGLPLCFLLAGIQLSAAIIAALLIIALAIWISNVAEQVLERKDPGCIVVDEIAGMVVTLIGLPLNLTTVTIGFILFRILDILKPFPIRILEKRLPGGLGIVADDVAAGIFANALIRILLVILDT